VPEKSAPSTIVVVPSCNLRDVGALKRTRTTPCKNRQGSTAKASKPSNPVQQGEMYSELYTPVQ